MSNPFQLTFTLKQHTPIIHFQHEQEGATLRATEVKPKLDQFLFEKLTGETGFAARKKFHELIFNGTYEQKKWKQWLVGKGKDLRQEMPQNELMVALRHLAFDYKVHITGNNVRFVSANGWPLFFGNTGQGNQNKYKLSISDSCQVKITASQISLRQEIENNLCAFFGSHNFGSRQSKSYGSYYPDASSEIFNRIKFSLPVMPYSFDIVTNDTQKVFVYLDLFYKSLRSGINILEDSNNYGTAIINGQDKITCDTQSRFYFKSLLFLYVKEYLKLQWEKKTIKEQYLNTQWSSFGRKIRRTEDYRVISIHSGVNINQINSDTRIHQSGLLKQQLDYPNNHNPVNHRQANGQKYIFKDLFGLSSSESWGSYGFTLNKKHSRRAGHHCNIIPDNDPDKIERFKSPLLFKIIKLNAELWRVYFKVNDIPAGYAGEWFSLQRGNNENLCLPIYSAFDFSNFLNWIFKISNFDINLHVTADMHGEIEFTTLSEIYKQLQNLRTNA